MLLKLMFGEHTNPEINGKHVQDFKKRNTQLFETMCQFERNLDAMPIQTEETFYVRLAVLLGKNMSKASMDWADKALQMIDEHKVGEIKK